MNEILRLTRSGLPLYLDMNSNVMAISGEMNFLGMGRKQLNDMTGLFANTQEVDLNKEIYQTYRGIVFPKDENVFNKYEMSYDITIVHEGTVNGEFNKTSGHYHGWNSKRTNTYGEVYEVILGEALFVLQKSMDFDKHPETPKIDDVILARVHAGQTLLVPPNYGHCSINVGTEPLVFSNIAYKPCPVIYDSVKINHGMAYFIYKNENGKIDVKKNSNYVNLPSPRIVNVSEDDQLGINFYKGIYESFLSNPAKFDYLPHPDSYINRIMNLLIDAQL